MQDTAVPPLTLAESMAPTASAENNSFLSADNNRRESLVPDDEAEAFRNTLSRTEILP